MIRRIALAATIACALGGPAFAGTGTLFKGRATGAMVSSWGYQDDAGLKVDQQPKLRAAYVARSAAACEVSRNPDAVKTFLSLSPAGPDYADAKKGIVEGVGKCLSGTVGNYSYASLEFTDASLRGLLAEAFLRSWDRPSLPAAETVRADYSAPWISKVPEQAVVEEMAYCLAETRPAEVVELIATAPNSDKERAARSKVIPFTGACLRKGATLKTDAVGLRLALATGLYHRIVDPTPAPANSRSGN